MAHYAFITEPDEHGVSVVTEVIVGRDEGDGGIDWEAHYGAIRSQTCKRTSYNTQGGVHINGGVPFRLNYAGVGYVWREDLDGFVPPCPGEGWTLDEATGVWVEASEI